MEEENKLHITEIDQISSSEQLNMMKVAMPYMNYNMQKTMALLIKSTEIMNTMNYFNDVGDLQACDLNPKKMDTEQFLVEIKEVVSPKQRETLDVLMNIFKANDFYSTYKNKMGNSNSGNNNNKNNLNNNINMMSLMEQFLTSEQKATFDAVNMMFNNMN